MCQFFQLRRIEFLHFLNLEIGISAGHMGCNYMIYFTKNRKKERKKDRKKKKKTE